MWVAAAATAAVVGSAALAGAQAAERPLPVAHPPIGRPGAAAAALPRGRDGHIPPPPSVNEDYGIRFDPISTRVRKAKVAFDLPPLTLRSYLQVCVVASTIHTPCPGQDVSRFPKLPFSYAWDAAFARNWVAVRRAGHLRFGQFPPVRVSMLAFGALPVTATAHLTQTATHGVYDPLLLNVALDISPIPPGNSVPGFGPAPRYKRGLTFFAYRAVSTGTVDIRLSNVVVDQQPLHVGRNCHTTSPAALRLGAPAGYFPQLKTVNQLKGKPGEFQPLNAGPAGYLQGSVDVPSFTDCHNGGDDLNPLITGMISGSDNPVNAYSPAGLQSWCLETVAQCGSKATAAQRMVRQVASGERPLDAATVAALRSASSVRYTGPPASG